MVLGLFVVVGWVVVAIVVVVVVVIVAVLIVIVAVVVVVSGTGEISLISHTFHPDDFSPGFASSINRQFSTEQSHDAIQNEAPLGVSSKNSNLRFSNYSSSYFCPQLIFVHLIMHSLKCILVVSMNEIS